MFLDRIKAGGIMNSVILSTYNGEAFVREQLDSIRNQTVTPDEVIIVDDCSTDSTPDIIRSYIEDNKLFNWKLLINSENKGWADNFSESFLLANGDLIFPCDQDDIWLENKIEIMSKTMQENNEIGLLIGNYYTWIQNDREDYIKSISFSNRLEKMPFDNKVLYVNYPGCVYCFRKDFYTRILPYRFPKYPHDSLLIRMAKICDCCYFLDTPVIKWRRHTTNATGKPIRTNKDMCSSIKYYLGCLELMKLFCHDTHLDDRLPILDRCILFFSTRYKAFSDSRLFGKDGLLSCIKYIDYYNRPLSFLGDVYRLFH